MPELPEVETMVRGVRPHLQNRTIIRMSFLRCRRRPIQTDPRPAAMQRHVRNTVIRKVARLGKRIVVHLNTHHSLVIEPRMTGLLLIGAAPTTEHRRIRWCLAEHPNHPEAPNAFEFWDRRGLGTVRLLNPEQLRHLRQNLGPDPLDMSVDDWQICLARTRRPVKNALLDQTIVAGIGNIYACEILHRSRISPHAPAASLARSRIERLAAASRVILRQAIRCEGSTLSDGTYRSALNRNGRYQNLHRVYQKAGTRCPDCRRSVIRRIVQAGRSTFYCPSCQKH